MEHGIVVEQQVKNCASSVVRQIEEEIQKGWRVVTMTGTAAGNVYVVFERYVTGCDVVVNCLGCLAGK